MSNNSWFDFDIKKFFNFSDPNKEEAKAIANFNKIKTECEEKQKVAQEAVAQATLAKEAEAAKIKAAEVKGGGKRKGTRKPKGKKNKKTRRN